MRPATIRSSREIDRIFREGAKSSSSTVVVLVSRTPHGRGPEGRVAFIAGSSLGGAVSRNRAKRRLREAARQAGAPWPTWDVVLLARPRTLSADSVQLAGDLGARLASLGVIS